MLDRIDKYFDLKSRGSSIQTEVIAGCTTFLAMAYIIFVNPSILKESGMDSGAVFVATCLAAALGTCIMGLYANYPIALAPGMGLNAFFTFGVVIGMGVPWQVALAAVFLSGLLFVALSLSPAREWIINSIPLEMKMSISAGIGFFLVLIGLTNMGIVVDDPVTLVKLGPLAEPKTLLAMAGFLVIVILEARKIPGSLFIGVVGVAIAGACMGLGEFNGMVSLPPSIRPTFLAMDFSHVFELSFVTIVLSFLIVDFFDTAGTLVSVAHRADLLDDKGNVTQLRRALVADSTATLFGATLGTSPTTSYIESIAGIRSGGRTGLTAVVVSVLFLAALFFAPLAGMVDTYATGPALVFIGCVMMSGLSKVDWDDPTRFIPAAITMLAIPLTYSIATGIGLGFMTYVVVKIGTGRWKEVPLGAAAIAILFLLKFTLLA